MEERFDDQEEMIDDQQQDLDEVVDQEATEVEDRGDNLTVDEEYDPDIVAAVAGNGKQDNNPLIPRERYNQVNAEKKAWQERAEALQAQLQSVNQQQVQQDQQQIPYDFDEAEERYLNAMMEGESDLAKSIRREIRQQEEALFVAKASAALEQEKSRKSVEQNLSALIADAYVNYPVLNPDSDTYNQGLVEKINRLQAAYIREGHTADAALKSALDDFMGEPIRQQQSGNKGNADAMRRNADAANRQPPMLSQAGIGDRARAASLDVSKMSEEEFAALPDKEKRRLRGD